MNKNYIVVFVTDNDHPGGIKKGTVDREFTRAQAKRYVKAYNREWSPMVRYYVKVKR